MAKKSRQRQLRDKGLRINQQKELKEFHDNVEPHARRVKVLEQLVLGELARLEQFDEAAGSKFGVPEQPADVVDQITELGITAASALVEAQLQLCEAMLEHALGGMDDGGEDRVLTLA